MSLKDAQKNALTKAFGIEVLKSGLQTMESENLNGEFVMDPIWVAQLRGEHLEYRAEVIVSIAHARLKGKSHKAKIGVLLISDHLQANRFLGASPFRSVDLGARDDMVLEALKNINMLPAETSIILDGDWPNFKLTTYAGNSWGYFRYSGMIQDEKLERLWQGLLSTVKMLAQAYDDAEINEFFDRY